MQYFLAPNDLYIFATNTDCYGDGYAAVKSPAVARGDWRQRVARRGYAPVLWGWFCAQAMVVRAPMQDKTRRLRAPSIRLRPWSRRCGYAAIGITNAGSFAGNSTGVRSVGLVRRMTYRLVGRLSRG
ncbi:hypothetical protein PCE31106_00128 [Pandoraea cepalis]|uniref:Uncharacterized protein n=1 Tax=Pandoraea cepalis TaxID=2508294 RepID=A0A5E4RI01_9BURK|nr:hypothetical protein PCE31106_00128 [Pandoraea cepalis]